MTETRVQGGKFKKGVPQPGAGRPKGVPNKCNLVLAELQKQGFDLIGAIVKVASTDIPLSDPNYIALTERQDKNRFKLLDRIAPALKMIDHQFDKDSNLTLNLNFGPPK